MTPAGWRPAVTHDDGAGWPGEFWSRQWSQSHRNLAIDISDPRSESIRTLLPQVMMRLVAELAEGRAMATGVNIIVLDGRVRR